MYKNSASILRYQIFLIGLATSVYRELKFGLFILGSKAGCFSTANIVYPLIGISSSSSTVLIIFIIGLVIRFILGLLFLPNITVLSLLLLRLPGLMGSLYLSVNSKYLKLLLSAMPMVLFIVHPIGFKAWPYSLYWLIPMGLSFYSFEDKHRFYGIFTQFLAASFTTHAFGSVIYLYLYHIDVETWYFLIPIVFWERLFLSLGSFSLYYLFNYLYSLRYYFYKPSYNRD